MQPSLAQTPDAGAIEHWGEVRYEEAVRRQEAIVERILAGEPLAPRLIFTAHPHVFTIGTSGSEAEVKSRIVRGIEVPVVPTGRGGKVTYHGPGQIVLYVIADLRRERDLKRHVWRLEEMIIQAVRSLGVPAERSARGIGVWAHGKKIASIGVRCRRWIAYHGAALNVDPDLAFFDAIIPCGLNDNPMSSLARLGYRPDQEALVAALAEAWRALFVHAASARA
ncbi:MAG: lipoyl(octanoyl) transferase [Zetaproteobacteria bacterium]|nr:MAG: lipoyl(octanoyl) transferase [Zetaproteobacteria bacterium]